MTGRRGGRPHAPARLDADEVSRPGREILQCLSVPPLSVRATDAGADAETGAGQPCYGPATMVAGELTLIDALEGVAPSS
jgi:hypothetical protein